MIFEIPLWFAITVVIVFILLFIYGYFWIRRHNRKENERINLNKDIHKIGKEQPIK